MVAIGVLFLGTGLAFVEAGRPPRAGECELPSTISAAGMATGAGLVLIWISAALTLVTGWDYLRKALPHLRDEGR
jgi:CDP-diacylglycerol--glycerol-3-phosphate 3-phosphatidyltransferase